MSQAATVGPQLAEELQKQAILIGCNVAPHIGIEYGSGRGPYITFTVWRWDQDRNADHEEFSSVAEVEAHLAHLATLPRYRLELVGNPRIQEVADNKVRFTVITDTSTGQEFWVRTADLEAVTSIVVHSAHGPPTIGNWTLDPPAAG